MSVSVPTTTVATSKDTVEPNYPELLKQLTNIGGGQAGYADASGYNYKHICNTLYVVLNNTERELALARDFIQGRDLADEFIAYKVAKRMGV